MNRWILRSLAIATIAAFTVVSCDKENDDLNNGGVNDTTAVNDSTNTGGSDTTATDTTGNGEDSIVASVGMPDDWVVELPSSIKKTGGNRGVMVTDTVFNGADYYEMMREFIALAEGAAEFVDDIISGIEDNGINQAMTIAFTGEDGREKTLDVVEDVDFDGETWELFATITDEDGSKALQVFWNNDEARGISILSPYDMDRNVPEEIQGALYKVYYSAVSDDYDELMEVSVITGLENVVDGEEDERFLVDHMKMFVGRNGTEFELYGNSNHPNVYFIDPTYEGGRNWAFAGKAEGTSDIAVAATCLPPSDVETNDNILEDYAFKKVIIEELPFLLDSLGIPHNNNAYVIEALVDEYSVNLGQPAYFAQGEGFIGAGDTPPSGYGFTTDFIDLTGLTPYIPKDIRDLSFSFK
jgi:hypothetical protein